MLAAFQMADAIERGSAGILKIQKGEAPDDRPQKVAKIRGFDISHQRAMQITQKDSEISDVLLAMDNTCLRSLHQICHRRRQLSYTCCWNSLRRLVHKKRVAHSIAILKISFFLIICLRQGVRDCLISCAASFTMQIAVFD